MRFKSLQRVEALLLVVLGLSSLTSPLLPSWADDAPRGADQAVGRQKAKDPSEAERREKARRYEAFKKERVLKFEAEAKAQPRQSAKELKEQERVYQAFQKERLQAFTAEAKAQPRQSAKELKEQERKYLEHQRLKRSGPPTADD